MAFNEIQKYCDAVCEQIRWDKAKACVSKEIENHICDQRDFYIEDGDNEEIATSKAIEQMGDPIAVGVELDKTHKPKQQWVMIGLFNVLILIGVFANRYIAEVNPNIDFSVTMYLIAIALCQVCYLADFTVLGRFPKAIYFVGVVYGVFSTMLSPNINALSIFIFDFECLYLVFPLLYALFIYGMRNKGVAGIMFCGIAFLPFVQILGLQGTVSGIFFYAIVSLIILCYAICKGWFGVSKKVGLAVVLTPTLLISGVFSFSFLNGSYRAHRFIAFIDPQAYKDGQGYIYYNLRENLTGATLFGQGALPSSLGMDSEWWSAYLLRDSFNLAYLINNFGWAVLLIMVVLFLALFIFGIRKALKEKSMLGSLIALTCILIFSIQALFYILGNIGYGVFFSFSLPFIFGRNEALFTNAVLMGFMMSVFRTGAVFSDFKGLKNIRNNKIFSFENGKLTINFR